MGNNYYLTQLSEEPHVVANYLKKVLKYMGEPLCCYNLYSRFRDLSGNYKYKITYIIYTIEIKPEQRVEKLRNICGNLPEINKNTFVYLIRFLRKVIEQSEHNMVCVNHNLLLLRLQYVSNQHFIFIILWQLLISLTIDEPTQHGHCDYAQSVSSLRTDSQ